jgi:hypothetical protein
MMGHILKHCSFTVMPMPDRMIKPVNTIELRKKQGRTFRFTNRSKEPYEWTDFVPEDDLDFQGLLEEEEAPFPDISAELPGVPLEEDKNDFQVMTDKPEPNFEELATAALTNAGIATAYQLCTARVAADAAVAVPVQQFDQLDGPRLVQAKPEEIMYKITVELPNASLLPGMVPCVPDKPVALPLDDDATIVTSPRRYPTRLRRSVVGNQPYDTYVPRMQFLQLKEVRVHRSALAAVNKQHLHVIGISEGVMHATTTSDLNVDNITHQVDPELCMMSKDEIAVWVYLMTQYSLKPGLRKLKEHGGTAAISELTQLHVMDTWTVLDPSKLTRDDKTRVLLSLLFLKEKRCGKIKGRACVNRVPQRVYIPKEDVASPTVTAKLMFITSAIAASKKRHVWCFDVPSAFVNMNVDENVLMVLKGELAEMMVLIVPQIYCKHITMDKKGSPVLYVKLQKALYGLMRASLLFYRKLRKELEDFGFVVNPYNPCVANKDVGDGKQLTVIWHMDGLMASCMVDFELTRLLCHLANIYSPKLMMHKGKKHNYLGVDLEFQQDGRLNVLMVNYLKNIIDGFPEQIVERAATPAGQRLFDIREKKEARPQDEEHVIAFHHTTAQLLLMATRARRDIQTAVAFPTTRVKSPEENDWGN